MKSSITKISRSSGMLLTSLSLATLGCAGSANAGLDQIQLGEPQVAFQAPLLDIASLSNAVGEEEGEPVIYYTVAGSPALFHVVGLHDYRLKATYPLPGASRAWTHTIAPDGSVYIGGVGIGSSGHLYRYRPGTDEVEDLGAPVRNHKFIWQVVSDEQGNIYGGTWEGGHVFRLDPQTDTFTDFGRIQEGEDYVRTVAWHGGFVYAGTGVQNGRVWRLNPETGDRHMLELPLRPEYEDRIQRMGGVYNIQIVGDLLFVYYSSGRLLLIYDLIREEWWEEMHHDVRGMHTGFASRDGRVFFLYTTGGVRRIDLETRETREIMAPGAIFRGGEWINLPNEDGSAFATSIYNGAVILVDPDRNFSRNLGSVATGQPTPLQTLEAGPDGMLYISGYMGTTAAQLDPRSGDISRFNMGQAEGIGFLGGRIYWGEYPHAEIKSSPLKNSGQIRTDFRVGQNQDRPFAIAASDTSIFFGTIPGYGELGGALTIYEPGAGENDRVRTYRNIVPNQSIVGLAYRNGRLYGSTSIHGGLGIEPSEKTARVFAWDVEQEAPLAVRELDLPGAGRLGMIGSLSVGPDGNIYGAANGTIFVLDPETLDLLRHRTIYPDITSYGRWRSAYLRWDDHGLLYVNLGGRITIVDPKTLDSLSTSASSGLMTLGADGSIYYVENPHIMKIEVSRKGE